jgi:hypothetical protein
MERWHVGSLKGGTMTSETMILLVIAAIVIIGAIWFATRKRHSDELREQFGPEYDQTVNQLGGRGEAESELDARRKRVDQLDIRPLSSEDQQRFAGAWKTTQAHFVDEPADAINDADRLVSELMQTRGYPVGNFEQRAADVSVNHPNVVKHYRAAHIIALDNERGAADTENLRQAMVHYKALFEELLDSRITTIEDREEERHARAS